VDALPTWDGDHSTAIDYFWEVGELASLKGWMPEALGHWLPTRLKKNSEVQLWFSHLPPTRQEEMRSHYMVYLKGIRDKFLGRRWKMTVNAEFDQQTFRQKGHEDESPQRFIGRRIRFIRLLANSDNGGPLEVFLAMKTAPISWSTILILENIRDSEELYEKVNEHYEALIDSVRKEHTDVITTHNLASSLRRLGFQQNPLRTSFRRSANIAAADGNITEIPEESEMTAQLAEDGRDAEDGAETLKQVFQTLKRWQRPPPKGGYPFPKHDDVMTRMGRVPPSPCKVCGSANHWDRECPDWAVYSEKIRRGLLVISAGLTEEETGMLYHSAYLVLMNERLEEPSL
jgi:hypothetical protein